MVARVSDDGAPQARKGAGMRASTRAWFSGRSALITGGSSGIGLACARKLAACGATVTLVARRADVLSQARASIIGQTPGAAVHTLALDVSDAAAVGASLAGHLAAHRVDTVFNNAGTVMPGRFLELEAHHLREMMDVNYFGAVHVCRAVLPHLVAQGGGAVLNTASMAGALGIYGYTGYAASKFALVGFSEALRAEMWPHAVQVSVCLPPDTDTPQLAFEDRYKPAETRAIAGTAKTMTADAVADAMLDGVASGRFTIVPGQEAGLLLLANRLVPGFIRWFCDRAQRKAAGDARRTLPASPREGAAPEVKPPPP
jgi:3-dehydrosphinganine reductase